MIGHKSISLEVETSFILKNSLARQRHTLRIIFKEASKHHNSFSLMLKNAVLYLPGKDQTNSH